MPNQTVKNQIAQNDFFLRKTTNKIFMYLLAPFILQNSFKNSESWFRVMRISTIFGTKMAPFVLNKNFLVQTIVITFIYLLALFIVQNLKKFLQQIQSYEDAPFLGPKWSICPKQIFFGKLLISFSSTY